ncbi:MAG: VCBS repeat-containing protein [Phycisphaeraceae bacterium]|nr:VCBS repeat-containing protein [Phycisphaeraceae bacterium]
MPIPVPVLSALLLGATAQFDLEITGVVPLGPAFFPTCVSIADLDGDGLPDLAVSGRNVAGRMAILRGQGPGLFGAPEPIVLGAQSDWVEIADFNGDGHQDLAVALRTTPGIVQILRGTGGGGFVFGPSLAVDRFPTCLAVHDIDGDGTLDLIVSNYGSDTLSVLRGHGDGTFASAERLLVGPALRRAPRPYHLLLHDFDGDGTADLAVNHTSTGRISVFRGHPDGAFTGPRILPSVSVACIAALDLDLDGRPDIASFGLAPTGGALRTFRNVGEPGGRPLRFEPGPTVLMGLWTWYLVAADLDRDGRDDLIASDASLNGLLLLKNNAVPGVITLGPPQPVPTGLFPRMIRPIDLFGDCMRDLVLVDIATHAVVVLRNRTLPAGPCAGPDLNSDGAVDFADLLILLGLWGGPGPAGDLDGDGTVGLADLLILLAAWSA